MIAPILAGHGTHTSGLVAANGDAGIGVEGTCKHCGIAMWKGAYGYCAGGEVVLKYNQACICAGKIRGQRILTPG